MNGNGRWKGRLKFLEKSFFYAIILFLPAQLGKHFWPQFSFVDGIRIDYLSPTLYFTDILILLLFATFVCRHSVSKIKISNFKFPINFKTQNLFIGLLFTSAKSKLCLLVILVFIGSIFSLSPIAGLYKLVKIIELTFFGWYIASYVKQKKDWVTILILLTIGVVFESVLALWQFVKQASSGGLFWFLVSEHSPGRHLVSQTPI